MIKLISLKKYNQREVSIEELKEDFNKRENGIYTLGVDINYYKRLNEILSDNIDLDNFLKYMGDLTFKDNDLTDSERKDVVIKDALLRDEKFDDESIGHSGDLYNVSCLYKQLNSNSGNFLILFKDRYDEVLLNLLNASEKVREELNKFKENLYFYEILNHICDYFIKYGKQENSTFTNIKGLLSDILKEYENSSDEITLITKIKNILSEDDRQIIENITAIQQELRVTSDNLPEKLGHYTALKTINKLISPLNDKYIPSVWLTNINQLNDPLEGKAIYEYFGYEDIDKNSTNNVKNYKQSYKYVSCASAALDNLPMWKQYADDAQGVSLVYEQEFLKKVISHSNAELYQVCYIDNEGGIHLSPRNNNSSSKDEMDQKVEEISNYLSKLKEMFTNKNGEINEKERDKVFQYLEQISYLFKRYDYFYEDEYRFMVNMEGQDQSLIEIGNEKFVPMLHTKIRINGQIIKTNYNEVILGPKSCDIDYVAPYICYCNPKLTNIYKSKIKFR